jgi:hypothetical protein
MERIQDYWYALDRAGPKQRECPDCGGLLLRRTSVKQSPLCTEVFYQCRQIVCGATFKGYEEIVYRLKVPFEPNPLVRLPISPSQKHAGQSSPGASRAAKDCCPACGGRLRKQVVETDIASQYMVYVECSRQGCEWALSGLSDLEPTRKAAIVN